MYFSSFGSKINEFEQKKIGKQQQKSKNLKDATLDDSESLSLAETLNRAGSGKLQLRSSNIPENVAFKVL